MKVVFDDGDTFRVGFDQSQEVPAEMGAEVTIPVTFDAGADTFAAGFDAGDTFEVGSGLEPGGVYPGPYEATPKFTPQYLHTSGQIMADDVNVKKIPVYEVSNQSGGTTVTIGGE